MKWKNRKQLGAHLKEMRENLGLSQQELGDQIGVSKKTISNWEKNRHTPQWVQLEQIEKYLDWVIKPEAEEVLAFNSLWPLEGRAKEKALIEEFFGVNYMAEDDYSEDSTA